MDPSLKRILDRIYRITRIEGPSAQGHIAAGEKKLWQFSFILELFGFHEGTKTQRGSVGQQSFLCLGVLVAIMFCY
jgi:hypothetical protein